MSSIECTSGQILSINQPPSAPLGSSALDLQRKFRFGNSIFRQMSLVRVLCIGPVCDAG